MTLSRYRNLATFAALSSLASIPLVAGQAGANDDSGCAQAEYAMCGHSLDCTTTGTDTFPPGEGVVINRVLTSVGTRF